uniref:Long-chain-fatty-acid--CoA ligase n=1 Tax=Nothobranchius kadleci TaxID=1051664 RepID=A0A1A8C9J5_NOTKA
MELYLISILLASIFIIPFAMKTFSPYVWMDFLYFGDLLRILVTYGARRRRRPLFFVLDRFLEQTVACPDKLFIAFGDERHTYADADRKSNKIARALQSQAGYTSGDTVALFMGNEPTFVFTWLALAKLGSPVALLNYNIRTKSLLHCFNCCKAKVLVAASDLKEAVEDVLPSLIEQGVVVLLMTKHCDTSGIQSFLDKVEEAPDSPLPRSLRSHLSFKSPAVYIYTSGTTGLPKAALVNQNRLLTALAILSSNGVTSKDVMYTNLPLYHTAGFFVGFIGPIETGSTIVLKRKFSASQFWDDCRKYNVTVVQYIGEVMRYLCCTPKRDNDKDHKVRLAIGNGIRAEVWKEFLNRFGNVQIREFYASTEGNIGFLNYPGKMGAVGRVHFLHQEANVYGVQVPGHEGRVGMAAVSLKEDGEFDGSKVYKHVVSYLPSYARPRFIRIQSAVEVTGTFKQMKVKLVAQGFDPGQVQDPLYFLDDCVKSYVPVTAQLYSSILSGSIKL